MQLTKLNLAARMLVLAVYVLAAAVLIAAQGCAGLGRVAKTAVGFAAPEYKATADNLYSLLADDQIFRDDKIVIGIETPDGRRWPIDDIKIVGRAEDSWSLGNVPPGVMRRLSKAPRSPSIAEQSKILSDAFKSVPTTPETQTKKKD